VYLTRLTLREHDDDDDDIGVFLKGGTYFTCLFITFLRVYKRLVGLHVIGKNVSIVFIN
jgi:hypothetical protein